MSNILIINGHPHPEQSLAGKAIIDELDRLLPQAQVRTLAALCRNGSFDVQAEQQALSAADTIVWHFPFYWYSVPALMKKWIDDLLTHGFAYGSTGTALHGKKLLISLTTGAPAAEYARGRSMTWPMEDFLPPLLQTANYCGMQSLPPVWSNGMIFINGVHGEANRERILAAAKDHAARIAAEVNA